MQGTDNEDLETWLAEVELASEQIKKLKNNNISVEEFDKQEKMRQEYKKKLGEKKKQEENEVLKKQKEGRFGKGEQNNYTSFCKYCFKEYQLPTPVCLQCKKNTETYQERIQYLREKVQDFKHKKLKKEERNKKWELWKKTKAMLWKKTSTNYSKWDFFTSSSEEENDEKNDPILPKNDPNFMALEADMDQRAKKRKEDRLKAEELKERGNKRFQEGDYEKAVLWYSEALDLCKDYKALWINRALAWIKLKYYKKAINDCTRILEYCECFEDGYMKSKDSCFKALLRRAFAYKERKQYSEALKDCETALKIFPNDKEILDLKEELAQRSKHSEIASQILKEKQQITKEENLQQQENYQDKDQNKLAQEQKGKEQNKDNNNDTKVQNEADDEEEKKCKEDKEKSASQGASQDGGKDDSKDINKDGNKDGNKDDGKDNSKPEPSDKKSAQPEKNEIESDKKPEPQHEKDEVNKERPKKKPFDFNSFSKLHYTAQVDSLLQSSNEDIEDEMLINITILTKENSLAKSYLYERKGLDKILSLLKDNKKCYVLLDLILTDNPLYQLDFHKIGGIAFLHTKLSEMFTAKNREKALNNYEAEEILEVLNTVVLTEKVRNLLKDDQQIIDCILGTYEQCIGQFKRETSLVNNYLTYLSNLCYQESKIKKGICAQLTPFLNQLYQILKYDETKPKYEIVRSNIYNLLVNFLNDEQIRKQFQLGKFQIILEAILERLSTYDIIKIPQLVSISSNAISVFTNMTFQASDKTLDMLNEMQVGEALYNKFFAKIDLKNEQHMEMLGRLLQVFSKLKYKQSNLLEKGLLSKHLQLFDENSIKNGFANHAIRFFNNVFGDDGLKEYLLNKVDDNFYSELVANIKKMLFQEDEIRYCNSCILGGKVVEIKLSMAKQFYDHIPQLITQIRDKTGNRRKNSAIFLSKLAKDNDNIELIRKLHGIEILASIHQFCV